MKSPEISVQNPAVEQSALIGPNFDKAEYVWPSVRPVCGPLVGSLGILPVNEPFLMIDTDSYLKIKINESKKWFFVIEFEFLLYLTL